MIIPPDGTSMGDVRHTLSVYKDSPAEMEVLRATSGLYEKGEVTGISLGDLRAVFQVAEFGEKVLRALTEMGQK